jgi:hypothetical protein
MDGAAEVRRPLLLQSSIKKTQILEGGGNT